MFRMKKKWRRGGIALAMAAVMSMSVVTPVWATEIEQVLPSNSESPDATGNIVQSQVGDKSHKDSSKPTGAAITDSDSVHVYVNNPTTYAVTIPKAVKLTNTSASGTKTVDLNVECDLAPTQTFSVAVANVTLQNKNGIGTAKKELTSTMVNPGTITNVNAANKITATIPRQYFFSHFCTLLS